MAQAQTVPVPEVRYVDGSRGERENRVGRENRHWVTEMYPLHIQRGSRNVQLSLSSQLQKSEV